MLHFFPVKDKKTFWTLSTLQYTEVSLISDRPSLQISLVFNLQVMELSDISLTTIGKFLQRMSDRCFIVHLIENEF